MSESLVGSEETEGFASVGRGVVGLESLVVIGLTKGRVGEGSGWCSMAVKIDSTANAGVKV
jgi:hypothetical protein